MEDSSRFQRLFDLLENGSTQSTRSAAGEQIAEVALSATSSGEGEGGLSEVMRALLSRVVPLLGHSSWDTRLAAADLLRRVVDVKQLPGMAPAAQRPMPEVALLLDAPDMLLGSGRLTEPSAASLSAAEPDTKRAKSSATSSRQRNVSDRKERQQLRSSQAVMGEQWKPGPTDALVWPELFQFLVKQTQCQRWETRHGALVALRCLVDELPCPSLLSELASCSLTLLTLDRFNDYMADRVISPVRECAAQLLGSVLTQADEDLFISCVKVLLQLVHRPEWEARHAGLLGLRYAVLNRPNLMQNYATSLIQPLLSALEDEDDDVIAVAAETILPLARQVASNLDATGLILDKIWELLQSLDDLAASISCLLALMKALYQVPEVAEVRLIRQSVSLLFPLFRHGVPMVRQAVVETVSSLLAVGRPKEWAVPVLSDLSRYCFQNFVFESDEAVLNASRELWMQLIHHAPPATCCPIFKPLLTPWYALLSTWPVENCPSQAVMLIEGSSALAQLLGIWPVAQLAPEVLTLIKLVCSQSKHERIVGALCFAWLAGASPRAQLPLPLWQAFHGKLRDALNCNWKDIFFSEDFVAVKPVWSLFQAVARQNGFSMDEAADITKVSQIEGAMASIQGRLDAKVKGGLVDRSACARALESLSRFHAMVVAGGVRTKCAVATAWVQSLPLEQPLSDPSDSPTIVSLAFNALLDGVVTEIHPKLQQLWARQGLVELMAKSPPAQVEPILRQLWIMLLRDLVETPRAGTTSFEEPVVEAAEEEEESPANVLSGDFPETRRARDILATRGARAVFLELGKVFGAQILSQVDGSVCASLWSNMDQCLTGKPQDMVDALRLVETLLSSVPVRQDCFLAVEQRVVMLCNLMNHASVWEAQNLLADGIAAAARLFPVGVLRFICITLVPRVESFELNGLICALLTIHKVLKSLLVLACPFLPFLVVPLLGSMSHRNNVVRHVAAAAFAQVVGLLPLEAGTPDPAGFGDDLSLRRKEERLFIQQLIGGQAPSLENMDMGLVPELKLRPYQEAGVAWLAFLAKYKLHGILADDMGLGKTVQTLCAVAGAHRKAGSRCVSLVVCPASVVHHWVNESKTLFCEGVFRPYAYVGSATERATWSVKKLVGKHNLFVTSYEVLRNDAKKLAKIDFLYCVLDEGHVIRNPASKVTEAAKSISATHRLVLSGTPLQNQVVELWSLFDFLSPGYLGSQKEFNASFGKPILASKDPKAKPLVRERGVLALEGLHRQILPFIMRRTKETVLQDLPPKIIQDFICDMSPLQALLYEDYAGVHDQVQAAEDSDVTSRKPAPHIFRTLQLLRKICNHPSEVLKVSAADGPEKAKTAKFLKETGTKLESAEHSGKLVGLEALLRDCGIGQPPPESGEVPVAAGGLHRVLLFCQHSSVVDLIENLLFKKRMPTVTYCRLDSSLPLADRFSLVTRFNRDPTIDVMLLTVKVGGLGLNLTGADTVIFFEHDWNPQVDMQAMDRAHRLGQKRTVNVYRLITRDTIEEKILSLQQFKIRMTKIVVNEENASMSTMDTGALLDLAQGSAMRNIQAPDEEEGDADEAQYQRYLEMQAQINPDE